MSGHDDLDPRFERDLRETLDELGSERIPAHLLVRVRGVPAGEPVGGPGRAGGRLFSFAGLAAAAAVAAIVVGAFVLPIATRPASVPPGSQAAAASVASPGTAAPSAQASAVASAAPSAPAPSATPIASQAIVAGGPVPAGFNPLSVTFASPAEGWVLGTFPCTAGQCTAIAHTADAGATWTVRSTPSISAGPGAPSGGVAPVTTIRFADAQHGWMYGSQLWATNDGGTSWTQTSIAGFTLGRIFALEVARGTVHAIGASDTGFLVATSAVGSGTWQLAPVSLLFGAGPVPEMQLVLSGGAGWALENDRTVVGGIRLSGGGWAGWTPPCATVQGPALLAASSAQDVVAVCDVGRWSTPEGVHLFVSADGGATFTETGPRVPVASMLSVATPARSTIVVAGAAATAGGLLSASFDGGRTWTAVLQASGDQVVDLGFTTATQGVAIAESGTTSVLFITRDGGHTWSPARFS